MIAKKIKLMRKTAYLLLFISVFVFAANAQKVVLNTGDVKALKDAKQVLVRYDYSAVSVGEFTDEKDYVDKNVAEYNDKGKGLGDRWLKAWNGARKSKYHPGFEGGFNQNAEKSGITISQKARKPKYVLTVKTVFIEPGYKTPKAKRQTQANFEFSFVDAGDSTNVIAELTLEKVPGANIQEPDYDPSPRIVEAYAKAGKMLAEFLTKTLK